MFYTDVPVSRSCHFVNCCNQDVSVPYGFPLSWDVSLPRLPRFFFSLIMDNSPVSPSKKRDLVVPEANRIRVVPMPPNRMEVVVHTECEQFSVSQACYHNSLVNTDGRLPEKSSGLNTETA